MDVESLAKQLILKGMTEEQQNAVLESIKTTMGNARTVQKQRIGENVQVVVQALKKIEADIKSRYDETGKAIEKRVASIKDGKDGRNGVDGKAGRDGRSGKDGAIGPRGADGLNGTNGLDGKDGISITDAHIDFDGSLIITLSDGKLLNVGEVVSQDIAEKIKVIQTMSTNGAVGISDEGSSISTGVKNINFVGASVTASASGDDVTVNVSAGTGTVTSVAVSGGTTGLTTSGGPITTTGTITLAGTLAVASGGTGTATPSLVAGTNITSITGSWPNQTINAGGGSGTVTSVAATGGTGISVSGSPITTSGTLTITNTAPDQTVALTQGGTTTITGTYPNFTISSADQFVGTVTSVTGTSPIASSGGTTPAISLASGYGDTLNPYASKTANFVLAAPNGSAGVPTFRAVVAADIPTLNQNTTGNAATVTTNANLTGAVTSIGNATSLGSFTSAQLLGALTDETGTGAAVFATSPTLVTPALGTPASGVVTNLTGTASININGTVGATTATTGAFTTLSASGVTTVQAGTAALPAITTTGDTNTGIFFPAADTIAFSEGGAEAMRITSAGKFCVATTGFTSGAQGYIEVEGDPAEVRNLFASNNTAAGSGSLGFFAFKRNGTYTGGISQTDAATAYNTSSDYRLKENVASMTGALAKVSQLKPCTYTWKASGLASQGFIAHELSEVCPEAVFGEKDAVYEDGSIKPQGIDVSFLVATLTAAIQEQQALIIQLQADVAALKASA